MRLVHTPPRMTATGVPRPRVLVDSRALLGLVNALRGENLPATPPSSRMECALRHNTYSGPFHETGDSVCDGVAEREDLCGRTLGEFVLRERIGEGGFGAVYRCEQPLLGREAVVKVLHQRLRRNDVVLQRFMREAQLASRLDHPYAAHVYAFGIEHDDGLFWIALEMVQGTTLNRWCRERGPPPLEQLVPFFERVAEVVQTAHDRGIVHRDLKPSNVMVVERAGRLLPKLLDFGIAKLLDEAAAALPASPTAPHFPVDDETPDVSE